MAAPREDPGDDRRASWTVRRGAGPVAVVSLCAVPVLIWATSRPLHDRFASASAVLDTWAKVGAISGTSAFALNLVLGARLRFVGWVFGGLDREYRVHRVLGAAALLLVLSHVLFLALSRAAEASGDPWGLFLPRAGWPVVLGLIALATMLLGMGLTLFARLNHELFVLVQRGFGIIFVLAAIHVFAVPSMRASSPALVGYLGGISAIGLAAFVFRSVLGRFLVPRRDYRVEAVNRLDRDVVEIVMAPAGRPIRFIPGQFVYVAFLDGPVRRESHPYTLASAPSDHELKVVVKALGDYTGRLMDMNPGGRARVQGPHGGFCALLVPNIHQVWIAGGIGITPFLSMARTLDGPSAECAALEVDLYYCVEKRDRAFLIDDLFEIADRHPRFRVIPIRKDDLGRVTAADIEGVTPHLARNDIFICGPPAMMRNLTSNLLDRGVPRRRIHSEEFGFP